MSKMQRILSRLYDLQEETQGKNKSINSMVKHVENLVIQDRRVSWGI